MESAANGHHDSSAEKYRVIIIGAGIAGLSAARYLGKNGITDVLILEATEKAGGRIKTQSFGDGLIELGAQWVHGEQNEFCQLVKSSNHRHSKTSWEGKGDFLLPDGSKVDNSIVNEVLGWVEDTIEEVESTFTIETLQNGGASQETKVSMGSYLLKRFCKYVQESYPEYAESSSQYQLLMAIFQWAMSFQRIDNSCHRMNDVSLYRWSEFEVNPGEHYNNFGKGAQAFVDEVLSGSGESWSPTINYNCPVANIKWDENLAKVTTLDRTIYTGEVVLVTVSVGVLKSTLSSLFTPSLPERLSDAIIKTGFGPVTKIFLHWSEPWWPSDLKGFQLVWPTDHLDCCTGESAESLEKRWHKTITGFDPVLENPNTLLAWLGGPEAVYAETLTDEQIATRCVQVLKEFTRIGVPKPVRVVVSKWNTNKFVQGAYCFRSVDGDLVNGDICSALCDPVVTVDENGGNKPVIFLAGEALSKTHYSTLHGAYESGASQAGKIIQYFESRLVKPTASKGTSKDSTPNYIVGKNGVKTTS